MLTHRFVSLVGRYKAKIGIGPPLEAMANPLLFVVMLQATATTTTKSLLLCFFRFLRPKRKAEKFFVKLNIRRGNDCDNICKTEDDPNLILGLGLVLEGVGVIRKPQTRINVSKLSNFKDLIY